MRINEEIDRRVPHIEDDTEILRMSEDEEYDIVDIAGASDDDVDIDIDIDDEEEADDWGE